MQLRVSALLQLWLCCAALAASCADALNLKLKGVNYDFRQGADYDMNRCKSSALVSRELRMLSTVTPRVRIYSVSDCNVRPVFRYAKQYNLTVWLGVWATRPRSSTRSSRRSRTWPMRACSSAGCSPA